MTVSRVLMALGELASDKAGGDDKSVAEMWRACPYFLKIRIALAFRRYATQGGRSDDAEPLRQPRSWRLLLFACLAKEKNAMKLDLFRFVALVSSLSRWYVKVLLLVLEDYVAPPEMKSVATLGFTAHQSTEGVTFLLNSALGGQALFEDNLGGSDNLGLFIRPN